eukprot:scaffold236_cov117-Skeletonema_dohrnii-CCMP3373.AAC.3
MLGAIRSFSVAFGQAFQQRRPFGGYPSLRRKDTGRQISMRHSIIAQNFYRDDVAGCCTFVRRHEDLSVGPTETAA